MFHYVNPLFASGEFGSNGLGRRDGGATCEWLESALSLETYVSMFITMFLGQSRNGAVAFALALNLQSP